MNQTRNNLDFLDMLTIVGFIVGLYSLYIALENLQDNKSQNQELKEILNTLDGHLHDQDLHLASQDRVLENLTK